jgi:hypothetical protein
VVRRSQSAWGFVPPDVVERAITELAADLDSGRWAANYGVWLRRPTFEGSLRLVVARPS